MAGNLMLLSVLAGLSLINAQNITSAASTYSTVTFNLAATTSTPLSTAVPSATGAATATLGNYALPINQSWCASPIYCPGEILQAVQLSGIYADGKTFVDKPTLQSEQVVVNAFQAVKQNGTVAALINWIDTYFGPEGSDVLAVNLTDFQENPPFLPYVKDPILQGWLKIVNGYWRSLARQNTKANNGTVSSLIPLNNTFIVPGGRFRENYYWDSYFICVGLLESGLTQAVKSTLSNFMDLIADYGFIPNGGRIYYLNRSQPPLFTQLLYLYLNATNDQSFLTRALALNDAELQWWDQNRSIDITGPSGQSRSMFRYYVTNSAPRPESYEEDWATVNGPLDGTRLNGNVSLYSNLASGAESGMDYSAARWCSEPLANTDDAQANLRTLNINDQVPVDLNAIQYRNFVLLASMYTVAGNNTRATYWAKRASDLREAVLDVSWNATSLVFRDFNITSGTQANIWSSASYYPYWARLFPPEVVSNQTAAQKAFSGLGYIVSHYNSTIPNSLLDTSQQWDVESSWPPEIYIALQALRNLPSNVSSDPFTAFGAQAVSQDFIPRNHFGFVGAGLPSQPVLGDKSRNITNITSFDALGNVGNLTSSVLGWRDGLAVAIANRYTTAAFCSWYSTGGSVPGLLSQLSAQDLNATGADASATGQMFEKFSPFDADAAGAGGEYTVVTGFGWTNAVAIWIGRHYGSQLNFPQCPAIIPVQSSSTRKRMKRDLSLRPNLIQD